MKGLADRNNISRQAANTWRHSEVVWRFAYRIAKFAIKNGYQINLKFLKTGCYIHDIGRMVVGSKGTRELKNPIYHFYEGYHIMKYWGYPELARICLCHACGGGLDRKTNIKFGFYKKDYFPKTIEEKIIAYSDARTDFKVGIGPIIWPISKSYKRFKIYPGAGRRLMNNHRFILKITNNKIK